MIQAMLQKIHGQSEIKTCVETQLTNTFRHHIDIELCILIFGIIYINLKIWTDIHLFTKTSLYKFHFLKTT